MLSDNINAKHFIGGDFNFECSSSNNGFSLWLALVTDFNLCCCDSKFSGPNYTYHHDSLDQYSWLDHFFISDCIKDGINDCIIMDDGHNLSDHLSICCTLYLNCNSFQVYVNQ